MTIIALIMWLGGIVALHYWLIAEFGEDVFDDFPLPRKIFRKD